MRKNDLSHLSETINTLRGIAISAVLISHYLDLNISGDNIGFGNAWVATFFFLSGYCLYYSLNRLNMNKKVNSVFLFYYQRAIRIYPLLWFAWVIELVVRQGKISFWIPTGLFAPGLYTAGHYWFIQTLLQCYILAPLIYIGIKNRPIMFLSFLGGILIALNIFLKINLSPTFINILHFINARWRGVYFLYLFIFALGMYTPFVVSNYKNKITSYNNRYKFLFWVLLFFVLLAMKFFKKHLDDLFIMKIFFLLGSEFLILFLCFYALFFQVRNSFLQYLGKISYPIYLFHVSYYLIISDYGNSPFWKELLITLLFFPIFIFVCKYFEKASQYINIKMRKLWSVNNT